MSVTLSDRLRSAQQAIQEHPVAAAIGWVLGFLTPFPGGAASGAALGASFAASLAAKRRGEAATTPAPGSDKPSADPEADRA